MNRSKKTILLCVLLAVLLIAVCLGARLVPTVHHALRISELLRPMVDAENQAMHMAVSAVLGGKPLAVESDVYLVTEGDSSYLAMAQNGACVYLTADLLLLENGKAFRLSGGLQRSPASLRDLLPHIQALYEALKIRVEKTETETVYSVAVTAAQAQALLRAVSLGGALPTEGMEALTLRLTEKDGGLEAITFSGKGNRNGTELSLRVTLSGFRSLAAGEFPIPDAVKQSAATVDPKKLFSLTEDLYRLVLALAPLGQKESVSGTLALMADCGPLQLDLQLPISEWKTTQPDWENLQALPEAVGWLCMEGDLRCTRRENAYVYTLKLDQAAVQDLACMLHPALEDYAKHLTQGSVTLSLESGKLVSMELSIAGKLGTSLIRLPITVQAAFFFA